MTNSKKTKRALLSSVIALILCMSMLVGTTFAWFTDSVVSGNNKIVAGNLDVELEYLVDGQWEKVTETTNVFEENTLWEPGHTEVVYLRVSNLGTLALKYQLGINVAEEITSVNADGEEIKLSEHLVYGAIEGQTTVYTEDAAGRKAAREDVTNATALSEGYTLNGDMEAGDDSEYVTLVVYMPETVGNEANYKTDAIAPQITMGINLMATQKMSENDSFDNTYDEGAKFDALPQASFTKLSVMPVVTTVAGETVTLDTAYSLKTTQELEEAQATEYAKWHADFVVSFNNPVAAESIGLAGQYDSWSADWVAFDIPDAVAAGEAVRLLQTARSDLFINYEELCSLVKEFKCGAFNNSAANAGTTMTVELRLYEVEEPSATNNNSWNVETGNYIVAGSYSYTFAASEDAPVVNVTAETVENQTMTIYGVGQQTITLDDAYTFSAQDTAATVEASPYKDWIADYYVTLTDVAQEGLILAGAYGEYGWIGFEVPAGETYTDVGLLEYATTGSNTWTYADIITEVGTFTCGAVDAGNNAGATLIVELRLTNPADATESIVVSHIEMAL